MTRLSLYVYTGICKLRTLLSLSWTAHTWQFLSPHPNKEAIKSPWNNWWNSLSVLIVMWSDEGNSSPLLCAYETTKTACWKSMDALWLSSQSLNQLIRLRRREIRISTQLATLLSIICLCSVCTVHKQLFWAAAKEVPLWLCFTN